MPKKKRRSLDPTTTRRRYARCIGGLIRDFFAALKRQREGAARNGTTMPPFIRTSADLERMMRLELELLVLSGPTEEEARTQNPNSWWPKMLTTNKDLGDRYMQLWSDAQERWNAELAAQEQRVGDADGE